MLLFTYFIHFSRSSALPLICHFAYERAVFFIAYEGKNRQKDPHSRKPVIQILVEFRFTSFHPAFFLFTQSQSQFIFSPIPFSTCLSSDSDRQKDRKAINVNADRKAINVKKTNSRNPVPIVQLIPLFNQFHFTRHTRRERSLSFYLHTFFLCRLFARALRPRQLTFPPESLT